MAADFDRLATIYSLLEHLSFGRYLHKNRTLRITSYMRARSRALIYGDGDGRFLKELQAAAPEMKVTAVDGSVAMLRAAQRRLPAATDVTFVHADALDYSPDTEAQYDLVVTHFFLDCFDETGLDQLLDRVDPAVAPGALWIVSDFAIPARPALLRLTARALVRALYLGFRILTGLRVQRLPDHARVLREHGWRLLDRQDLLRGLLISEVWQRSTEERATLLVPDRSHLL